MIIQAYDMTKVSIYLLVFLGVFSCQRMPEKGLDGIWRSIGSSRILQVQDTTYAVYDLTSISCFPVLKAAISDFGKAIYLRNDTLCIDKGPLTYKYIRTAEMPELCLEVMPEQKLHDPMFNFEVFAKTVEENYTFFELNNLDWDSLYRMQKRKLAPNATDVNLYHIIDETLVFIKDNHGYLEASDMVYDQIEEATSSEETVEEPLKEYGDFEIAESIFDHYVQEDLTDDSWLVKWGMMENNTGFVQIKAMWLFADLDIPEFLIDKQGFVGAYVETFHQLNEARYIQKEAEGAALIMDRVMTDLESADRIILDVRFNGGGQEAVGFEILSRFNGQDRVVATQKLRDGERFSPVQGVRLKAAKGTPYLKPVYILTSPQTGSAAESFSMASMALPHVQRIGSPTQGALSTALEKKLPNGWDFALSNELFMDVDGRIYENQGVPPDYLITLPRDRQTYFRQVAHDLAMDKKIILEAINQLEKP